MIEYKFQFTEKPDGTMQLHWESPPAKTTTAKEQMIAVALRDHLKTLFSQLAGRPGFEVSEN